MGVTGQYYLWQNDYSNSLLAYRQALNYVVRTLNCMRRWRRCFITSQPAYDRPDSCNNRQSPRAGPNEITALMLLASDAFMQANYRKPSNYGKK